MLTLFLFVVVARIVFAVVTRVISTVVTRIVWRICIIWRICIVWRVRIIWRVCCRIGIGIRCIFWVCVRVWRRCVCIGLRQINWGVCILSIIGWSKSCFHGFANGIPNCSDERVHVVHVRLWVKPDNGIGNRHGCCIAYRTN